MIRAAPLLPPLLVTVALLAPPAPAQGVEHGAWDQYADPEQAGWSLRLLDEARGHASRIGSAAVMLVHDGHVVVAWGDVRRPFKCHSMRKSLLSALYGMHRDALDLDATLADLDIDDAQGLTGTERRATVNDLLRARSGIYHPAAYEPTGMQRGRPDRGSAAAGTRWFYNNWDFNTLGTIFNQETGLDLFEAFERRLANPLGMDDFLLEDTFYWHEPSQSRHPAYLFRLSARDAARFGLLFAQQGRWGDRQLVPADWVRESTRAHTEVEGQEGYGYMWWTYGKSPEPRLKFQRHDSFAARGTGAQLILVAPEAKLVYVHRSDTDNTDGVDTGAAYRLGQMLIEAQVGEPIDEPELTPLRTTPLPGARPAPVRPVAIALTRWMLEELPGTYQVAPGFTATLHVHQGRMFARTQGPINSETELFAASEELMFNHASGARMEIHRDQADRVAQLVFHVGAQTLAARPVAR